MDNFPKFIRNVCICEFTRLAGYRINLPFKAAERNALLQYRAKWAIINFVYLLITSFDLLFFFIPERY